MNFVGDLMSKVLAGENISKSEALLLFNEDMKTVTHAANVIRSHFFGQSFELCSIINAKSGKCCEDCAFCPQSVHHEATIDEYPLIDIDKIREKGLRDFSLGVKRFSVVASGKMVTGQEVEEVATLCNEMARSSNILMCASLGLLSEGDLLKLKNAGLKRYHNNLETSERFFPQICSTHSYQDKINTIKLAAKCGLEVCSGGIIGLGETVEDRVDMGLQLRALDVKSVPLNILNPIKGTPLVAKTPLTMEEVALTAAVFRFIMPKTVIRTAGGRALLEDKGRSTFLSGVNGAISGNMLTTQGEEIEMDISLINSIGFRCELIK